MGDYHHGNLRRALLDAALEVLAEQGVSALSLREVARRAGVSHGAPAHHFKDKTGLLTALAAEGFEHFRRAMEQARDAAPDHPLVRFAATGKAYVRFAIQNPQHFQLMFQHDLIDRGDAELTRAGAAAYTVLLEVTAAAQREGLAPKLATDTMATGAWAFAHGLATLWLGGNLSHRNLEDDLGRLIPVLFSDR